MARDLLEATRIDHDALVVTPRPFDAGVLIAETVAAANRVARRRVRRIVATIAADGLHVLADPERVRQIASNLIDNALKFTPRDSTVRVTVSASPSTPGHVEIAVTDEGSGVDLATAERLFERFHQAPSPHSRKGLGLGLYLCRELVRRQGGDIRVENVAGAGARFAFTLPAAAAVASAA
jgi:signal transduction histidine kinase